LRENCLKRKLSAQCPCGYIFDTLNDDKDAIVAVRLHFESFHKDFLPFGITDKEVSALLKNATALRKQKVSLSNIC
jgi:hypothetical protein